MTKKVVKMPIKHVNVREGNVSMTKYEKGYGIRVISKRIVKKAAFGEPIQAVKDIAVLREQMQRALDTEGKVFGLYHKKDLMGYYIVTKETLKKEQIEYPFEESIFSLSDNKKDEIAVYRLQEFYLLPECESMREGFEADVFTELKESMIIYDVKAIIRGEEALVLVEKKKLDRGKLGGIGLGGSFGLLYGIIFGTLFDNIAMGICFAMLWGISFGTIFTSAKVKELKPLQEVLAKEQAKEDEDATV